MIIGPLKFFDVLVHTRVCLAGLVLFGRNFKLKIVKGYGSVR